MREIRFRGKRLDNGDWVYGYMIGTDVIVGEIIEFCDEYFNTEFWWKVDPETVGQYTGLKDRNGKEIYEGDIVRYKPGWNELIGVVCFGHYSQDGSGGEYSPRSCVGFYVERKVIIPDEWDNGEVYTREEEEQMSIAEQEYEIIGNIYEHPHLMKGDGNDA